MRPFCSHLDYEIKNTENIFTDEFWYKTSEQFLSCILQKHTRLIVTLQISSETLLYVCVSNWFLFHSSQIRNAWDDKKSMARNLQEMGLAFDPNRTLPIKKQRVSYCWSFDAFYLASSKQFVQTLRVNIHLKLFFFTFYAFRFELFSTMLIKREKGSFTFYYEH